MKKVLNFIYCLFILGIVSGLIYITNIKGVNKKDYTLVVNGDNILYKHEILVKDGGVYIPYDTVKKVIDNNIFYDEIANKLIVTTYDKVIKFSENASKKSVNLNYQDCKYPFIIENNVVYVPMTELADVYNLDVDLNEKTRMLSIDSKDATYQKVCANNVNVYRKIDTKSEILEKIDSKDEIIVYGKEKLDHPRWYKVKTKSGNVGFIPKVDLKIEEKEILKKPEESKENKKIVMFWQQGNSLEVLGDKNDAINVASPDWFDLSSTSGDFKEKISQSYLNKAKEYGYKLWPMFSTVNTPNAKSVASELLNSEIARENTIKNILSIVDKYKLDGVNIDFENMKDDEKHLFTQFIRELAPLLREKNVVLSCDIYFVKYIERDRVAEACDYVMLMGYDQHWAGSSVSGSVSEISWVEKNINYLLKDFKVKPEKLVLGIPFYSKLWEEDGINKPVSKNLSLTAIENYIKKYNLSKVWDEKAGQNYVEHKIGSKTYKLWVEDDASIKQRVELVNKYNLAGISAWQKRFDNDSAWTTIKENLK